MGKGLLIALEGVDGSGTTSQLAPLAARITAGGRQCHTTMEPSAGAVGTHIRACLRGEHSIDSAALALLYAADRLDHLDKEITPKLNAGAVVLTDRYLWSSYAYQSLDLPLDWVVKINAHARPADANILLKVSDDTAAQRRAQRGGKPERFDAREKQRAIAQTYDKLAAGNDFGPAFIVDAEQPIDAVSDAVDRIIEELLRKI